MIDYNPHKPLIFNHIPKTAGTSVRAVFEQWFGPGLKPHYYGAIRKEMPEKYDFIDLSGAGKTCIYGHFNRARGFGVEDYYPKADQLMTFLRDPWERIISGYLFAKKKNLFARNPVLKGLSEIDDFVMSDNTSVGPYLPKEMTIDNFKTVANERFVAIGVLEHMDRSMNLIAEKLGFEYCSNGVGHVNTADRDAPIPETLRDAFRQKNQLEYALYDYACSQLR